MTLDVMASNRDKGVYVSVAQIPRDRLPRGMNGNGRRNKDYQLPQERSGRFTVEAGSIFARGS